MMARIAFLSFMFVIGIGLALFGNSGTSHGLVLPRLNKSCYPNNQFVLQPGDFKVIYIGKAHFGGRDEDDSPNVEIEIPPGDSCIDDSAEPTLEADGEWLFVEKVTGNTGNHNDQNNSAKMEGFLKVIIKWQNPSIPPTIFISDCAAELQEDDGDSFEAELEGTVFGFPYQKTPRRAVASISGSTDTDGGSEPPGKIHINIELGTTCFEELVVPECSFNEFEITLNGFASKFTFSDPAGVNGQNPGIWGFPNGYPDDLDGEACPGVFGNLD
jgi:hypothetical protein